MKGGAGIRETGTPLDVLHLRTYILFTSMVKKNIATSCANMLP